MVSLTIEVMLIAAGILPLIITTPRPIRAFNRRESESPSSPRRSN
jgi:hypothetical protein